MVYFFASGVLNFIYLYLYLVPKHDLRQLDLNFTLTNITFKNAKKDRGFFEAWEEGISGKQNCINKGLGTHTMYLRNSEQVQYDWSTERMRLCNEAPMQVDKKIVAEHSWTS